ncbi:hypothetical protein DFH09DRAFT_1106440 [Mycena vulgaris]|nr:hypothetical protein DFH09DRAFT_1106440 [Mycena vulgaris]
MGDDIGNLFGRRMLRRLYHPDEATRKLHIGVVAWYTEAHGPDAALIRSESDGIEWYGKHDPRNMLLVWGFSLRRVPNRPPQFAARWWLFLVGRGMPYSIHSLPPSSLNKPTYENITAFNYRAYRVDYTFVVVSGPVVAFFRAAWAGHGVQSWKQPRMLVRWGFLTTVS